MNKLQILLVIQALTLTSNAQIQFKAGQELPAVPTIPKVDSSSKPNGSVPLGDVNTFQNIKLDIPICDRPFKPSWESIEENYPGTPEWLRDAKFGIWVHFGPQAAGESGDWYARKLYNENSKDAWSHTEATAHKISFHRTRSALHGRQKRFYLCFLHEIA